MDDRCISYRPSCAGQAGKHPQFYGLDQMKSLYEKIFGISMEQNGNFC
jgi:hypothetical protein